MHEGNFEAAADLEAVPLARLLCIQHQNRKSATDGAATSALGHKRTSRERGCSETTQLTQEAAFEMYRAAEPAISASRRGSHAKLSAARPMASAPFHSHER